MTQENEVATAKRTMRVLFGFILGAAFLIALNYRPDVTVALYPASDEAFCDTEEYQMNNYPLTSPDGRNATDGWQTTVCKWKSDLSMYECMIHLCTSHPL